MLRFIFSILLFLYAFDNPVQGPPSVNSENPGSNEIFKSELKENLLCLPIRDEKIFKNLKEAEEYFKCLLKEREVLEGDFYGINLTAYRYVNIFYRLEYIHYRIRRIDEEIKRTKLAICELREEGRLSC